MITKDLILREVQKRGLVKTSDLAGIFDVSRQYASKLISEIVRDGLLVRVGSTGHAFYMTKEYLEKHPDLSPHHYSKTLTNKGLEEHKIFLDIQNNFTPLREFKENIKSIFEYAFSEMLNNAIEHSKSKKIKFSLDIEGDVLSFVIDDYGIGAFRNIMDTRKLNSPIEAIQDLLKGKTTTAPTMHSGEGIFFTSKIGDEFSLDSYGYQFSADNKIKDIFVGQTKGQKQGTRVKFSLNINDKHHLNDIFRKYTNIAKDSDYGFDKTEVRVRLYVMGGVHISRSQARRVLSGLEKFKVIVLDYDNVPTVGQAFADEVYRVFKNKYPKIEIESINMNETVRFMVERSINESK